VLLKAYACGIFPMAENADDPALYWIEPEKRGIIPLDTFHIPSRLARTVPHHAFHRRLRPRLRRRESTAARRPARSARGTWINTRIRSLYRGLFDIGHCHSVEVYDGDALVGGLYGVSLGRRISARACSMSRATPRRSRWCTWSRG
jgi:leucyl/phenylalanyl-tRNA--protein transferase